MQFESFLVKTVAALVVPVLVWGNSLSDYAFCGDCWCVPASGEACPSASMPETSWSDAFINDLLGITLENPIDVPCDPYKNSTCNTIPPLETGGVCAYEIIANGPTCPGNYSYR